MKTTRHCTLLFCVSLLLSFVAASIYAEYVQTVAPNGAGVTAGMLGYMFWAAEIPSARKNYVPTTPPNSCEGGMGEAATVFGFPVSMEPLRQQ